MRRVVLSLVSLLWITSSLPASGAADQVVERLFEAARAARDRGDGAEVTRILRAWATVRPSARAPEDLATEAKEALAWGHGARLRVYASKVSPTRLRVGIEDRAGAVDRLEVFATVEGGPPVRLTQAQDAVAGRREYLVPDGPRGIVVDAVMVISGRTLVLHRFELSSDPLAPPVAPRPTEVRPEAVVVPDAQAEAPDSAVAWWWIVGGAVAVALVGAAAWQETRF